MNEYVVNQTLNQEAALITAYTQATKSSSPDEQNWLEAEGIRAFMVEQKTLLRATFFVATVMFVFLYQHVNKMGLWLWFGCSVIFTIYRYWLTHAYDTQSSRWGSTEVLAFRAKHAWTFTASGVIWGLCCGYITLRHPNLCYHSRECACFA